MVCGINIYVWVLFSLEYARMLSFDYFVKYGVHTERFIQSLRPQGKNEGMR
jgi:hypothetical protein